MSSVIQIEIFREGTEKETEFLIGFEAEASEEGRLYHEIMSVFDKSCAWNRDILPENDLNYGVKILVNDCCIVRDGVGKRIHYHSDMRRGLIAMLRNKFLREHIVYVVDSATVSGFSGFSSIEERADMIVFEAKRIMENDIEAYGTYGLPLIDNINSHNSDAAYNPLGSFGFYTLKEDDSKIEVIPLKPKIVRTNMIWSGGKNSVVQLFFGTVGDECGLFCWRENKYTMLCGRSDSLNQYVYRSIERITNDNDDNAWHFDSNGDSVEDITPFDKSRRLVVPSGKARIDTSRLKFDISTLSDAEKSADSYLNEFSCAMDIQKDIILEENYRDSASGEIVVENIPLLYDETSASYNLPLLHEDGLEMKVTTKIIVTPKKEYCGDRSSEVNFIRRSYEFVDNILIYSRDDTTIKLISSNGSHTIKYTVGNKSRNIPLSKLFEITDHNVIDRKDYPLTGCTYLSLLLLKYHAECLAVFMDKLYDLLHNEKYTNFLENNSVEIYDNLNVEIAGILYPVPFVADHEIVRIVTEAVSEYRLTGIIPHMIITGAAGTGKTTFMRNLAKCFQDSDGNIPEILFRTASDVIAPYVGHTERRMFDLVKEADEKKAIIVLDEAYILYDNKFGRESIAYLLPIMNGDRVEIEKVADTSHGGTETVRYKFKNGTPVVWMCGYDSEMRVMISKNQGLYRRFKYKLKLRSPLVTELCEALIRYTNSSLKNWGSNISEQMVDVLVHAFEMCNTEISNYFRFGINIENSRNFGNYAGMEDFCKSCAASINVDMSDSELKETVFNVIDAKKKELTRQYKAVVAAGGSSEGTANSAVFEIISDSTGKFEELIGMEPVKTELQNILDMMVIKNHYLAQGIKVPKGVLLAGCPGCGKTAAAKAFAGELQQRYEKMNINCNVAFIPVSASELLAHPAGAVNAIKALFGTASEYGTAVIFIDEIDAIGRQRSGNPYYYALLQLMKEMDGFEKRSNIFILAATNSPESLDEALTRPGRFDRTINIELPEKKERAQLIQFFLGRISNEAIKMTDEEKVVFAEELAERTSGFTASALENLINTSARLYISIEGGDPDNAESIPPHRYFGCTEEDRSAWYSKRTAMQRFTSDVNETIERLYIGSGSPSLKESEFSLAENEGCSAVAVHEVGHALVSILEGRKPFEKITIIPRGTALGYVMGNRSEKLSTKKQIISKIRTLMGGRIAEELIYGIDNVSAGAAQDMRDATNLARRMVETWGMSDRMGMMSLTAEGGRFIDGSESYTCSESYRERADEAIEAILKEEYISTRSMLEANKSVIERLARYVFDNETVSGSDFTKEYKRITALLHE